MICRRCGAELPDNAIRCSNCGIKVNMFCPECRTMNVFGSKTCKNCGFDLLKSCPVCGCLNIYSATECRKCHTLLEKYQSSSKEENKEVNDFEVVRPFCSEQSSYIKQDCINVEINPEIVIKEDNSDEKRLPLVDSLSEEDDDNEIEKIFNIEDENQDVMENPQFHLRLRTVTSNYVLATSTLCVGRIFKINACRIY